MAKQKTSVFDLKECPECGGSWDSSGLVGIEDPRIYDGISWWRCAHCGATWDRWTEKLVVKDGKAT